MNFLQKLALASLKSLLIAESETENRGSSEQKLADAREAIADFFHATDLDFTRVELWQFLKAVTTEKPFSFRVIRPQYFACKDILQKIILACRLLLMLPKTMGQICIRAIFSLSVIRKSKPIGSTCA